MFISKRKLREILSRLDALESNTEKIGTHGNSHDGTVSNSPPALSDEWQNWRAQKKPGHKK